ncbi:GxGYxYP putative glycoside hydrolase C-terminal domain-containing protein [Saccharicrinis carchari]|uniref:GxGYxYP putative glycoside hydrolase C-terminal domain-containing protein n=1 Tax=Saccharicrinis carchari TaxID=1168039 RepID=A0A521EZC5_SACCC|nr:T9SS type A sorting domain-containing protein [Saccharicrinis carchari]SMO89362.1 GxGYxYP putative glycoside hydrolase C-terminal domain-containing protein [Saccharicrinis carchari]
MWFTNSSGYDIPVVTVKYSLWDFGGRNNQREGTPDYIANKLTSSADSDPYNLVIVHAWSGFNEAGTSSGDIKGAGAAKLCVNKLNENFKVVNIEEMIWRIRMHYRPDQTQLLLNATDIVNVETLNVRIFGAQGQVHLVGADANSLVEIYDITGKLKVSEYITSSEPVYNVKGILIVRVVSEKGITVNKIINL